MEDEEENSLADFLENNDYRENERWEIRQLATKKRDDAGIIIQHPIREEGEDNDIIETMGLSVSAPTPTGVVTLQNTSAESSLAERFVAFDVELIDDIIDALEEVKERHDSSEEFTCPCCAETFDFPDELGEEEYGYVCPECDYLL